ncbi:MAG TPA: non-ribosomal peptide synthetase, partial [Pyrinomonadaceae bacterium]|nr:non-ribosomal peptide synthetase [Pyrinomonadaceae bacterium]
VPAGATDEDASSLVGSGRTWLGQEIRIADPVSLRECRPGVIGEIWVAGPNVAQCYWNRPDETAETFKAYIADTGAGPFLRTGDLGFMQDGGLFVTGRLKDLIIVRGRNYFPHDIELTAESSHANLRPGGGAAFSVDVSGEERLVVLHEVDRHHDSDLTAVIAAIRQAVAEEHELQVYAVALLKPGSLPKTSSGKIQRHACRARFLNDEFASLAAWRASTDASSNNEDSGESLAASIRVSPDKGLIEQWLIDAVASRLRLNSSEIDRNRPVVYYGVDSLIAVDLTHAVETTLRVNLTVADLLQSPSLSKFAAKVFDSLTAGTNETPTPPVVTQQEAPLSYGQRALWFLHEL